MSKLEHLNDIISDMTTCELTKARSYARTLTRHYDKQLAPFDIRGTELSILAVTQKLDHARLHEIAQKLSMDLSSLSRTIGLLEKKGWITIIKEGHRTRRASLSETGKTKLLEAYPAWKIAQHEILGKTL